MLNNTIKYMLDNDLLCLDSIKYNKDIPIETNEELNELELKLRREIGFIVGRVPGFGKRYAVESDFEEFITKRIKRVIGTIFCPIRDNTLKKDQLFIWNHIEYFDTHYFPNWNGCQDIEVYREFWYCPDPENCYMTNDQFRLMNKSHRIKMKKHKSKK